MLGGAYSSQYKTVERQHIDTIKTFAENDRADSIARARKLSIETNKRRRALAIKRKTEAEREVKRRKQILAKRHDRVKEATERFQRAGLPARPDSGSSGKWSPHYGTTTQLEDALKIVRGNPNSSIRSSSAQNQARTSPTHNVYRQNSAPVNKPYFNKYANPSVNNQAQNGQDKREALHHKSLRNLNNSRSLFEQQLETHQQSLFEQQQKALRDFNKQMMNEIEHEKNVVNGNQSNQNTNGKELERSESLSTVDSLEDTGSNDTLRESCDLDPYIQPKQTGVSTGTGANGNNKVTSRNVTFGAHESTQNVSNGHAPQQRVQSASNNRNQNIDSYNTQQTQPQSNSNTEQKGQDQKQQFYQQRQLEIQQQLQDQKQQQLALQQKQQQELQQRILDQQHKQQMLLQQQFQEHQLEQQRKQQEQQYQQQQQLLLQSQQQQSKQTLENSVSTTPQGMTEEEKENQRPKMQMKAWGTPSPHPPTPASVPNTNTANLVTHTSPYTGKSTHTNVTMTTYNKTKTDNTDSNVTFKTQGAQPVQASKTVSQPQNQQNNNNVSNTTQVRFASNNQETSHIHTAINRNEAQNEADKSTGMAFLETVTNGLPSSQNANTNNTSVVNKTSPINATKHVQPVQQSTSTAQVTPNTNTTSAYSTQQITASNGNSVNTTNAVNTTSAGTMDETKTDVNGAKPPVSPYYVTSYTAAYVRKQNIQNLKSNSPKTVVNGHNTGVSSPKTAVNVQNGPNIGVSSSNRAVTTVDASKINGSVVNGTLGFVEGQLAMLDSRMAQEEGQDTADTDSVSTIYEEREPEPKEIRGILKRTGGKKTGSILKKSGSTGNMGVIRDSLEITRVNLQTSADEKEQRPKKRNVRFADLTYPDEPEHDSQEEEDDRLFVRRNGSNGVSGKPPRPQSAVPAKTTITVRPDTVNKPSRASSATTRTSSIPRAKTQIVRPQAAAHIITQGSPNKEVTTVNINDLDKKVMMVNSNFMEKSPSMSRTNQVIPSSAPVTVYSATSVNYSRPSEQKVNYAVSSIVMPKTDTASAPFIYPGYTKQGPSPVGSSNIPSHVGNGSRHDGAVFDNNGLRLDRTPTDEEINYLWDKVRTCLSRNSQATPDKVQTPSSVMSDGTLSLSRQAAPLSNTYIDGNALGQINSMSRVAQPQPPLNTTQGITRQNSLENSNADTYAKRYGLLQQRKQQTNPNSLKSRQQQQQQQGYTVYHAPVQSHTEPQATVTTQLTDGVTESMAGFLAAEQLAEQSVSESRIHQAMDNAQIRQQIFNAAKNNPKVKSALSVEEQRLLESLDRLNDKLRVNEATIPNNTFGAPVTQQQQQHQQQQQQQQQVVHVGGFKGHTPISQQRRVVEASPATQKARLRITSAALKCNIHRQQ